MLEDITEKMKVPENHNGQRLKQQQQPQMPESGVRRSTKISRPPE